MNRKGNPMRIDPFYDRQPAPRFVEDLSSPVHARAPLGFGERMTAREGEVAACGIYLKNEFSEGADLLAAAYADFAAFTAVTGIGGDRYPVSLVKGEVSGVESFRLSVREDGVTVTAEETEGVRRALIFIEEEMTKRHPEPQPQEPSCLLLSVRKSYLHLCPACLFMD